MSDEQLHDMFAAELADREAPPLGSLVDDALTRGRRSRRRRLILQPTAAIAAIGLAAGLAVGLRPSGGGVPRPATAPATSGTTAASWMPTVAPPTRAPVTDPAPATWQAAVYKLRSLLPSQATHGDSEIIDGRTEQTSGELVQATLDLAGTSAHASVEVQMGPDMSLPVCPDTHAASGSNQSCTEADFGSTVTQTSEERSYATVMDYATVRYGDGFGISVVEITAPGYPVVLSLSQLYQIAAAPGWGMTMPRSFVEHADQTVHPNGTFDLAGRTSSPSP